MRFAPLVVAVMACSAPREALRPSVRGDVPVANVVQVSPTQDTDHDLILDGTDRCPQEPEDWDAVADTDGCPDLDDDGDGILDAKDHCPDAPGSPSSTARHDGELKRPGCPPERCARIHLVGLHHCYLTPLAEPGMTDQDSVLRQLVEEMTASPEVSEVTLRAFRSPSEPAASALARLAPIRARLLALGWPARIALVLTTRTSGDPESQFLINGDITQQRFEYDGSFRRGVCTVVGDVYRPARPETHCRFRRLD